MFRIITGSTVFLIGLWLMWLGVREDIGLIVVGLFICAIGVAILLNKREDKIEEISNEDNNSEHHE